MGAQSSGRCREVVVIRRWSLTQVLLYTVSAVNQGLTVFSSSFFSTTTEFPSGVTVSLPTTSSWIEEATKQSQ